MVRIEPGKWEQIREKEQRSDICMVRFDQLIGTTGCLVIKSGGLDEQTIREFDLPELLSTTTSDGCRIDRSSKPIDDHHSFMMESGAAIERAT